MKKIALIVLVLLTTTKYYCYAAATSGNLNFLYGMKTMSSKWDTLGHDHLHWSGDSDLSQQPGEYGVELDVRDKSMPVNVVVGVRSSYRDHIHEVYVGDFYGYPCSQDGKYELRTSELNLGLRAIMGDSYGWNASLAAGINFAQAELKFSRYDSIGGVRYDWYERTYEDSGVGGGLGVVYTTPLLTI